MAQTTQTPTTPNMTPIKTTSVTTFDELDQIVRDLAATGRSYASDRALRTIRWWLRELPKPGPLIFDPRERAGGHGSFARQLRDLVGEVR